MKRKTEPGARFLKVRGVVQGVGFRPFVFRLARQLGLRGWVRNDGDGVAVHAQGEPQALDTFVRRLAAEPPPAARVAGIETSAAEVQALHGFEIRESGRGDGERRPTARISPDLAVCAACLAELFDPADRRRGYPYINCTDCGPRFSILLGLPYDRPRTTMAPWPMCADCAREYQDPLDRRFHAQPVACPACGPNYRLVRGGEVLGGIPEAARLLRAGGLVAVKGLGGYHLAADARDAAAVATLRQRKFRKEKPFALMARDLETARGLVVLGPEDEAILASSCRPIVLAPARVELPGVAPENLDLGVMLPSTPVHHLLFAAGAPGVLVMTSANRSSEPIAFRDDEAFERLAGLADAFLVGERPIARRVDDSVVRTGGRVLRRARGLAPAVVARLPLPRPVLAVGGDLKSSVTLAVAGEALVSQHLGDLEQHEACRAFEETVRDLAAMYGLEGEELLVMHDLHPGYRSTGFALALPGEKRGVQHHRAHVASVLAERGAFERRVLGVAFDGTGYGDDGTIWGGEIFVGSVAQGFERIAHLRPAVLPGGDSAARHPVQAAAGFLAQVEGLPDLAAPPFSFPQRYVQALQLVRSGVRTFPTTSVGRLFDAVAALLGFTRGTTFEGQAAAWLEHLARAAPTAPSPLPFPFDGRELDFRPALRAVAEARHRGEDRRTVARAFHLGLARAAADAIVALSEAHGVQTAALSGGAFQNEILLEEIRRLLAGSGLETWTNREVPPNDGGLSLGQAALALQIP